MNSHLLPQLQDFARKVRGYNMLFNYRLMNLCIKAEPAALMPVTVNYHGSDYNIEEVAELRRPDEYHMEIRANVQDNLQEIIDAIFDVHPEFVLDVKTEKDPHGKDVRYASYSMPDVNKDRYDLLNDLTKAFYNECVVKIDEAYAKVQTVFVDALLNAPAAEADEAKGEMKTIYDNGKDETVKIRDAKLMEIEEAYQKYLQEGGSDQPSQKQSPQSGTDASDAPNHDNDYPEGPLDFDVTKGMKIDID